MSDDRGHHGDEGNGSRQPGNVKPKLDSKKSCVHRSRSTDSEKRGRSSRRRERTRDKMSRRERGRSEETRRDRDGPDSHGNDRNDTECVVCFCNYDNIFKTPKLLSCGHTFCLECLARINVTSQELKSISCPVCREVTELPHGRDLPHLGNNQDIIQKLPPEMQRALSVRFHRNQGKLVLKKPPPGTSPSKSSVTLPTLKTQNEQPSSNIRLGSVELGQAAVVNVGRPPSRVRGRLRLMFRSDRCYYAVVATIVFITVVLMLIGILAFVIMPNVVPMKRPGNQGGTSEPP